MILLKITNASELVRAKAGKLFEKITPEQIDQKIVEAQVVQIMTEQLKQEGLKGEISIVKGIEIKEDHLITRTNFAIGETNIF
tara:strand:- start:661 stop:909 length:249 start_codon:yes stop_codon:yes gene_type:complete